MDKQRLSNLEQECDHQYLRPCATFRRLKVAHGVILVEGSVIVEVKATEKIHSIREIQLLTYLRLTNHRLGLLINFSQEFVKDGIRRLVNGF